MTNHERKAPGPWHFVLGPFLVILLNVSGAGFEAEIIDQKLMHSGIFTAVKTRVTFISLPSYPCTSCFKRADSLMFQRQMGYISSKIHQNGLKFSP